jgi:uncharacterized protein (TIGR02001 family)
MKKTFTLMMAGGLMMSGSAMAWESQDGQHSTSASVALSSEYVWRGISQSDEDPAISGSFDYGHSSGFYAGAWASNVDYGDDASSEIDIYAGFASEFGDSGIGYDVGVLRYMFPGEDYNFNEVYGSLSYSIFSLGVAHSSDALGSGEDATYYSLDAGYDLPMGFSISGGVGLYDSDEDIFGPEDSYMNYYVGVSKEFAGFGFDITYTDTDSDGDDFAEFGLGNKDLADGRFLFTISKSL